MLENYGETLPPEELRRSLTTIARNSRKMGYIINEMLLLAQMRQNAVECVPINMAEIVAAALERLEDIAIRHRARITTPDRWPAALGYAPWVEEIWVNYINNAIKYGGDPPEIELGPISRVAERSASGCGITAPVCRKRRGASSSGPSSASIPGG